MKRYGLVLFSLILMLAFAPSARASYTSDLLGNSTIFDAPATNSF